MRLNRVRRCGRSRQEQQLSVCVSVRISVQPPRSTCSSSLVILALPPASSSLRITDRSFRYASPCPWNILPSSLRQSHSSLWFACSCSYHIFSLCQLTSLTIHNSISLSLAAQNLFLIIDSLSASALTALTLWLDCFFWASRFLFLVFIPLLFLFIAVPCGKLRYVSFWVHVNIAYCIIPYRITEQQAAMQDSTVQ